MSAAGITHREGGRTAFLLGNGILATWLLYLLLAPTIGFDWINSWHNEQRAVQVGLLAVTSLVFALQQLSTPGTSRSLAPIQWLLIAFLALGLASSIRSAMPWSALAEVSLFMLLAALVCVTANVAAKDLQRYLRVAEAYALLAGTAYVLAVAVRYSAAINLGRGIDQEVLLLGYANPRFPSALHALLMPFMASMVSRTSRPLVLRGTAFLVLSLLCAINLGLGTRGIWFSYLLATPILVWLLGWKASRGVVVPALAATIVGVLLYWLLFQLAPLSVGQSSGVAAPIDNLSTLTSREILWMLARDAILSAPVLGIGPMHFATLASPIGAHPHNWPLQVAAEWGLPAFALLGTAVVVMTLRIRSNVVKFPDASAPAFATLVGLVYGLVDGNLVMPVSQSAFALVLGLMAAQLLVDGHDQSRTARVDVNITRAFVLLSLVGGMLLCIFAYKSYGAQADSIPRFHRENPGYWVVPRFWEQGLVNPITQ